MTRVVTCDNIISVKWVEFAQSFREDVVAVFRIRISEVSKYSSYLYSLLQYSEIERAKRYHKEEDRIRFLIARASLRILLGKFISKNPSEINFKLGENKKPILTQKSAICFNTSHSGDLILIAISRSEVGIDIEKANKKFPFRDILTHSFNQQEQDFIIDSTASCYSFFQTWTRKEALVKATAQGIDANFSNMPSLDGRHEVAIEINGSTAEWTVSSFEAAPEYIAAIARPSALTASRLIFCDMGEELFKPFAEA
jgi:4'-phosphopantetheinyl transferase